MGLFDDIGGLVDLATPVLNTVLDGTPVAPFAGAVVDAAKGDFQGAAANAAKVGVDALIQATPLGDIPVVGQIATYEANSLVDNALGINSKKGVATRAAVAAKSAPKAVAAPVKMNKPDFIPGVGYAPQPAKAVPVPPPPGYPPGWRPTGTKPMPVTTIKPAVIAKPYGGTFQTRTQWEQFAARPETAGGTVHFPKK